MKTGYQKALKVISVIAVILAILVIIFGILLIISGGIIGAAFQDPTVAAEVTSNYNDQGTGISAQDAVYLTAGFGVLGGIVVIIDGVISLIVGILGIRGANNPAKIGPFKVFAIIGLICSLLWILILAFGAGTWEVWLSACLEVAFNALCVWLAVKIQGLVRAY